MIKSDTFPKVFVISVKSGFENRQAFINKQMKEFGIEFEYMLKFDINDRESDEVKNHYFGIDTCEKINAKQSLVLKHLEVLREIKKRNIDCAIIFEDDVILDSNFLEVFSNAMSEYSALKPLSIVSLGHANHSYVPKSQLLSNKYLYLASSLRCTDSLLIRNQESIVVLNYIDQYISDGNKISLAVDSFYDYIFPIIGISCFWLHPTIVTQGSMNGMFASVLDQKRLDRTLFSNKVHYLFNKFVKKLRSSLK